MLVSARAKRSGLFETHCVTNQGALVPKRVAVHEAKVYRPRLRATSPDNSNSIRRHLTLACAGNIFDTILWYNITK